jgi:hypothetical protein
MKRQLSAVLRDLENAGTRVEKLAERIPDAVWTQRNDSSRWSVSECLAHLNLTSEAFIPRIRKAIEEARQLPAATGEYKRDFLGALFGGMVGPLKRIGRFRLVRVKTTPDFVPGSQEPKNVSIAEFRRLQGILADLVRESDGRAIDQVRITSPFGEKIQYNCYSAFVMIPRHQMRHIEQAEEVWGS